MKRNYKIMLAVVGAVAVIAAAIATTAFAASRTAPETATVADYQAWGCPVANDNYEAVAKLLGMTVQEIQTQLDQGKSLAEIAATKGITEDKLVATIFAPMKEYMQQQVTAGNWTQAQLDAHLKQAEQHVRQLVNIKGDANSNYGCGGAGTMGGRGYNGTTPDASGQPNTYGRGGMMGGGSYGGMMGGYNGATPGTSSQPNSYGRGGMMGGSYGGMMGGGNGGMMGGSYGGMMGGGNGGMMGGYNGGTNGGYGGMMGGGFGGMMGGWY